MKGNTNDAVSDPAAAPPESNARGIKSAGTKNISINIITKNNTNILFKSSPNKERSDASKRGNHSQKHLSYMQPFESGERQSMF